MKIRDEIINILSSGNCIDNKFYLPQMQLDRKLYTDVNKILEQLGGKWSKKEKAHIFTDSDFKIELNMVIAQKEIVDWKKDLQYFPTPKDVAEVLVDFAELNNSYSILEPSAGTGNIADVIRERMYSGSKLYCVEIYPPFIGILECKGHSVKESDFLNFFPKEKFDRIIMNPPFAKQMDIQHITHAYENCLSNNGVLVSIISPGYEYRQDKRAKEFRELIEKANGVEDDIPSGAFKESGTMIGTKMIKLYKC